MDLNKGGSNHESYYRQFRSRHHALRACHGPGAFSAPGRPRPRSALFDDESARPRPSGHDPRRGNKMVEGSRSRAESSMSVMTKSGNLTKLRRITKSRRLTCAPTWKSNMPSYASKWRQTRPTKLSCSHRLINVTQARAKLEKSQVEMLLATRRVLTPEQAQKLRDLRPLHVPPGQGFGPPEGGPGGHSEGGPGGPPDGPPAPPPSGGGN